MYDGNAVGSEVESLVFVLVNTDPDLWEPGLLPGESFVEASARREAARDITDDLLDEFAAGAVESVESGPVAA